jgi:CRISPR-associated protein Csb1
MPEDQNQRIVLTPESVLKGASPLVLTATLRPVAGLDRFQPAGFPEMGHVIYKAPRENGDIENVCIVDSPASMANHLESVCMRGPHDLELDDALAGMPYLRCVTAGDLEQNKLPGTARILHATSLSEGHRIASTYFLGIRNKQTKKWNGKGGQRIKNDESLSDTDFGSELAEEFGIKPKVKPDDQPKVAHVPADRWWDVYKTIFKYDPNALVHGVLFPQFQIKIARFLTAHLEAFGAGRVDRSGVKFDRLGKTTSGQPIFAVDDATASEIRATFLLDVALLRSFGRSDGSGDTRGLNEKQKEFLTALALWKIDRLLNAPFRYRSGCHLELMNLKNGEREAKLNVDIKTAIEKAAFRTESDKAPIITDIFWPHDELYREAKDDDEPISAAGDADDSEESESEDS